MSVSLFDKELMMLHIVPAYSAPAVEKAPNVVSWKHYDNPARSVIHLLASHFLFDQRILTKQLSDSCRPLVLTSKDAVLITLSVISDCTVNNNSDFEMSYLTFLFRGQDVVTLGNKENAIFCKILNEEKLNNDRGNCHLVIFNVLKKIASQFIDTLSIINEKVEQIENNLKKTIKNKEIFHLLEQNKMLNFLSGRLKSNLTVLRKLKLVTKNLDESSQHLLNDVLVEMEQAQIMAEIHNINLSNLMDAYSAAVENNLSLVVQHLSVYVLVAAIPMGVAGVYGMNTPLPIQDEPYALALLGGIAVLATIALITILKIRRII